MKKRLSCWLVAMLSPVLLMAQGWPAGYEGVMLQGFYWDSFNQSKWTKLEAQADELSQYFTLVWIPQSADCGGLSMGYDDLYWFPGHYNSSFGTEEELRSMIKTFKEKGIGTIADVVINHRRNVSNWVDFPRETYNGETYELTSTDIVANDDNGATKAWATQNGYSLSANDDTGEGWDGMRDLDHKSENVQRNVKAYLKMLLNDLGYVGFRYDMVKGYSGSFTKMYNEYSQPQFSVGECWDGTNTIKNWIEATEKTSAAFDFQFRYTVRNAANDGNWTKLAAQNDGNWPLVSHNYNSGSYKQWAVTFVENHDTERRANAAQDPLRKDTLAANAYMLAMPGTPCVFFTHWLDCKQAIKAMIDVRRAAGIQNTSEYSVVQATANYYAVSTVGSRTKLLAVVGKAEPYTPAASWVKVLAGHHYAYYLDSGANTAWADLPSGLYEGPQQVTLTAVSGSTSTLVYTLDGTTPTASSPQAASGTKITIEGDVTLKVGLLVGNAVSGIVTRTYQQPARAEQRTITVYVNTDKVNWPYVNFWTWGGDDTHAPANKTWPGDRVTTPTTVNGRLWYGKQFTLNGDDDYVNFVFSTNSGSPQTVDVVNITTDKFFEISTERSGSNYLVTDLTSENTAIGGITTDATATVPVKIYTLDGRLLLTLPAGTSVEKALDGMPHGLYLINNRKYVK